MPIQMVCDSTPSLVSAALRDTLHSASTTNGRMSGVSGTSYGSGLVGTTNGTTGAGGLSSTQSSKLQMRRTAYDPDDHEFGEDAADDLVECISQSLRPGGQQMKPIAYEEGASFNTSLDQLKSKYIVLSATTGDGSNGSQHSTNTATNGGGGGSGANGPSSMHGFKASTVPLSSSATALNGSTKFSSTAQQSLHGAGKTLTTTHPQNGVTTATASPAPAASGKESATLPTPKRTLFPREDVQVGWKTTGRKWHVGAGMINMGNTCYLNSTLQALFHVPAIANWLLGDVLHRERCDDGGSGGSCIICAMAKTLIESQSNQSAIKPYLVYSKLRLVCKHLVPGRQEDAHEFLRYLVEAMEKSYLGRYKNSKELDQYSKETTPLNQILGGYLRSEVKCPACHHVSTTFQHFEDLLLDIRKANSIDEALEHYFARERLEENGYKCEACKRRVAAMKQFSLERAPFALCVQLKRFSVLGGKINKHVELRPRLDLTSFSSPALKERSNGKLLYRLTSMVTHLGSTQHCGHYTAIGHTDAAGYHVFDDSSVRPIGMHNLTTTNAYILFYELESPVGSAGLPNGVCRTKPSATVGQPSSTATLTSMGHLSGDGAGGAGSSGTSGKASNASPLRVLGTGGGHGPAGGFLPSKLEQKSGFIGSVLPTTTSSATSQSNATGASAIGGSGATAGQGGGSSAIISEAAHGSSNSKHSTTDAFSSPSSNASTLSNASPLASPVKLLQPSLQSTTLVSSLPATGGQPNPKPSPKLSNSNNGSAGKEDKKSAATVPLLPSMPKLVLPAAPNKTIQANSSNNTVVSLVPYETDDDSSSSDEEDGAGTKDKRVAVTTAMNGTKRPHKQTSTSVQHYSNGLKSAKMMERKLEQQQAKSSAGVESDGEGDERRTETPDERQEMGASRSPQIIKTKTGIWKVSKSSNSDQLSFPDSSSSGGSAPSSKASSPARSPGGSSPSSYPAEQQRQQRNGGGGGDNANASALTNGHRPNDRSQGNSHQQPLNGGAGGDKRKPMTTNGFHQQSAANQANGGGAVQMLLKMSHRGYGAPVKSWDGQETAMDRELASERREERKRQIEDDRELEMDRGRVKKSKSGGGGSASANGGFASNVFQLYQNGGGKWGGNGSRNGNHYNNGHNHHHQNNYRGGGSYYSNGNGQRHHGGGGGSGSGFRSNGRRFGGRNGGGGNFHSKGYNHHQRSESSGGGGGLASGGGNNGSNGYYHR
uniref:Ubiquitin carboxyl-terminal hydrolase 36 n=1 Tax=Anopheles atroparvus TaxID=41427 RepID=A0AAG5D990_ANOAO